MATVYATSLKSQTDASACNYDADATDEDGSCTYAEDGDDCDGVCDADSDGVDEFEIACCQDETAELQRGCDDEDGLAPTLRIATTATATA